MTAEKLSVATVNLMGDGGFSSLRCPSSRSKLHLSQGDISDTHVRKLETMISKLGRFLDPIIPSSWRERRFPLSETVLRIKVRKAQPQKASKGTFSLSAQTVE